MSCCGDPGRGDPGRAGNIPALEVLDGLSRAGSPGYPEQTGVRRGGSWCVDVEGNVKRVLRATGGTKGSGVSVSFFLFLSLFSVTLLTFSPAAPQAQGPA
ncbi:uncharacterized protein LAESUDRAFT_723320 [Laetiporus sulphureus 93-53]|uniref:Uncharacterized protein n=1 Tax=Laetiporus sulphureus 93-53 TaxID=1314785 RepID=A0A165FIB6_9APHY|nr:uncharacterized protein LAESUDRAFT_723320 [Laetiporus sulphureus 93-53]KZT09012.1 hypothetical protein LAESUDRAFT_723320 [Laetiporus sulphureus 93-53]